ncbi:hypothetical protein [Aquibacillus rhizosphaerae]|uniref:EamA domain-containing protein n=1 Tax=Aquibacillus rhizosphaerae TaxID=3051431 RepID=A0ABT7LE09_9BACI|nr:hypothetical protein [Aquibacillus sp. LR5S19]MDL4842781.1 hypothetical protein [Aquibacillus sp. LR5S19]
MKWKLRIPLLLLTCGLLAGLIQRFSPEIFLELNYFVRSAVFIGTIISINLILEKIGVNEKEVYFPIGVCLILVGFLFDYWMV